MLIISFPTAIEQMLNNEALNFYTKKFKEGQPTKLKFRIPPQGRTNIRYRTGKKHGYKYTEWPFSFLSLFFINKYHGRFLGGSFFISR